MRSMNRTDASHPLEAARMGALDAASLTTSVKGTITGVQTATDGSADWMIDDALKGLKAARLRIESAERCLRDFQTSD